MKMLTILVVVAVGAGCATTYDSRLNGTWKSNREATIAEAFRRDSRWSEASAEKAQAFEKLYGHMVISYTNNQVTMQSQGDSGTFGYEVVAKGKEFVVIRTKGGFSDDQNCRMEFDDDLSGYWIDAGWPTPEKFDRIKTEQLAGEVGASSASQP